MAISDVLRKAIHKWTPSSSHHHHRHHHSTHNTRGNPPRAPYTNSNEYDNNAPPQTRDRNHTHSSSTHSPNFNTYTPEKSPPRRTATFRFPSTKRSQKPTSHDDSHSHTFSYAPPHNYLADPTFTRIPMDLTDPLGYVHHLTKGNVQAKREKIPGSSNRKKQKWGGREHRDSEIDNTFTFPEVTKRSRSRPRPKHMARMESFSWDGSNCGVGEVLEGRWTEEEGEDISPRSSRVNSRVEGMAGTQREREYYRYENALERSRVPLYLREHRLRRLLM